MNIGFFLVRHPPERRSPIMPEVIAHLRQWGAEVRVIHVEEELLDLSALEPRHDLYVLKSGSEMALSVAGALHRAGATVLNPWPVAAACRDKIVATSVLARAGLPTPQTWTAHAPSALAAELSGGPLVVKPYRGSQGRGVRVVREPEQLLDVEAEGVVFAQRYHEPEGRDHKLYVIGEQVFGVQRVWPAQTYEDKLGEPLPITPELRELALATGEAFGIELLGLDVVFSEGRPWIVDVSSFPGFKGVPDAGLRLADYIFSAAQSAKRREPLLPTSASAATAPVTEEAGA